MWWHWQCHFPPMSLSLSLLYYPHNNPVRLRVTGPGSPSQLPWQSMDLNFSLSDLNPILCPCDCAGVTMTTDPSFHEHVSSVTCCQEEQRSKQWQLLLSPCLSCKQLEYMLSKCSPCHHLSILPGTLPVRWATSNSSCFSLCPLLLSRDGPRGKQRLFLGREGSRLSTSSHLTTSVMTANRWDS